MWAVCLLNSRDLQQHMASESLHARNEPQHHPSFGFDPWSKLGLLLNWKMETGCLQQMNFAGPTRSYRGPARYQSE